MASETSKSPSWPKYETGRPDYIYALGVLSANFNDLESWLKMLLGLYVKITPQAASYLIARLDNAGRLDLLTLCFEASPHTERIKAALRYFVKGYATCAENHNILLHSQAIPMVNIRNRRPRVLFFKMKRKAPYTHNTYAPSVAKLRSIADSTHAFARFGSALGMFVWSKYEAPKTSRPWIFSWPKRPAPPKLLSPQSAAIPKARRHAL